MIFFQTFSVTFNSTQWWKDVPLGPPDIILGIFEAHKLDPNPHKVDLSVGAYRDNYGKPYVLPSVLQAEQNIVDKKLEKESDSESGDIGSEYFREVTYRLAVGEKLFNRPHVSVQVSKIFSYRSSAFRLYLCLYFCARKISLVICCFARAVKLNFIS